MYHTLTYDDFPPRLQQIPDPPTKLYIDGNLDALFLPRLAAVVGTREPTKSGIQRTEMIVLFLALNRFGVVSGLAAGIDQTAHWTALACCTPTIAVLGSGLHFRFPAEADELKRQIIAAGGAIVSEYSLRAPPTGENLRRRNRLQTALSVAVFPVEGAKKSGTAWTCRYATEQGRPLYGVLQQEETTYDPITAQLLVRGDAFDPVQESAALESLLCF